LASVIDIDRGAVSVPSELPDPPPEQANKIKIENKQIAPKINLIAFIKFPVRGDLKLYFIRRFENVVLIVCIFFPKLYFLL